MGTVVKVMALALVAFGVFAYLTAVVQRIRQAYREGRDGRQPTE
ncbi:MAG TPA: hypothetical protein VGU73_07780 [Acidimicrobiia bacterium]|nr:hypothetical protein [Acidimicrobiia bacterium]